MKRLIRTLSFGVPANRVVYKPIDKEIQEKAKKSVSKLAKEMMKKGNYNENRLVEKAFKRVSGRSIEELKKLSVEELDLDHTLNDGWHAVHEALDNLKGGTIYGPEKPLLSEYFRPNEQEDNGYLTRITGWIKKHPVATFALIGTSLTLGLFSAAILHGSLFNNERDRDGDGLIDVYENSIGTDPHNPDTDRDGVPDGVEVANGWDPCNIDTDGDYVSDGIEEKNGSDPKKVDTDGGGIDDFNELYTFETNPIDPSDDKKIIENVPHVNVRYWNNYEGGTPFTLEKYVEVSMRCPLVKYYGERAEIKWQTDGKQIVGRLFVDGEQICNGGDEGNYKVADQPSYYFTDGDRRGNCSVSSIINNTILKLMGFKTKEVTGKLTESHKWNEVLIDGDVYVSNFNALYPRDEFYSTHDWTITSVDYDANWYQK
jgi:hypothetical protein